MKLTLFAGYGLATLLIAGTAWAQEVSSPKRENFASAMSQGHNAHASVRQDNVAPVARNEPEQTGSTSSAGPRNIEMKRRAAAPAQPAQTERSSYDHWRSVFGARQPQATGPLPAEGTRNRWLHTTPQQRVAAKTFFGMYRVIPRETVDFREKYAAGTIIVKSSERRLYYVLGDGRAIRYAIGVGREGASWAGTSVVSDKREWPDWVPTPAIRALQPDLPPHMKGGPSNPLGARALYLGQTMYRIHGTNEPWMIGEAASAGCIRMTNDDAIDLYNRTRIGAMVVVR